MKTPIFEINGVQFTLAEAPRWLEWHHERCGQHGWVVVELGTTPRKTAEELAQRHLPGRCP